MEELKRDGPAYAKDRAELRKDLVPVPAKYSKISLFSMFYFEILPSDML